MSDKIFQHSKTVPATSLACFEVSHPFSKLREMFDEKIEGHFRNRRIGIVTEPAALLL